MKHELTAKRLQLAINNANMPAQELANRSGVAKASISQYVNGSHKPSNISSGKMAPILDVNPLWLMGFDVPMKTTPATTPTIHKGVSINVLGRVAAGIPVEAITDIIDTEEIPEEMAKTGEFFGLQIHGDSMEPRMYEGDVVIVRKQEDAESGDIVIAMVNGDDATCKRLMKYAGGISLISLNSKYPPMPYSNKEIEEKPVKIVGKVVELRGKF
ncbi:XRE family transcriptional regulator [Suilimivivens sp.]|uniref:helix-turn-helix domain-containing protein n=1 Tax=Suilimivivens sp. TaxID=2981669 RepID=UPI00307AF87F